MKGKAKFEFEKWYLQKARQRPDIGDRFYDEHLLAHLYDAGDTIKNGHIIEWLDSIEIIIEIGIHQRIGDLNMWRGKINNFLYDDLEFKVSRQEATEAAIKKAVEIFNEKYT